MRRKVPRGGWYFLGFEEKYHKSHQQLFTQGVILQYTSIFCSVSCSCYQARWMSLICRNEHFEWNLLFEITFNHKFSHYARTDRELCVLAKVPRQFVLLEFQLKAPGVSFWAWGWVTGDSQIAQNDKLTVLRWSATHPFSIHPHAKMYNATFSHRHICDRLFSRRDELWPVPARGGKSQRFPLNNSPRNTEMSSKYHSRIDEGIYAVFPPHFSPSNLCPLLPRILHYNLWVQLT